MCRRCRGLQMQVGASETKANTYRLYVRRAHSPWLASSIRPMVMGDAKRGLHIYVLGMYFVLMNQLLRDGEQTSRRPLLHMTVLKATSPQEHNAFDLCSASRHQILTSCFQVGRNYWLWPVCRTPRRAGHVTSPESLA